ncbi:hypothetical protein [Bacteroides sp.]|uniref:hypothetical protein n=1 Tax=Bacteroides sp. TaxID=29523 RepID=UPI0026249A12|nr:hypothetical protein [Bacteroides sp.]MDD3040775.1 hypothetical protein [Bacteroides sp.]
MEKILVIDGRDVKFKSTGAFLLRYKAQFGRDALRDIFILQESVNAEGQVVNANALELEIVYDLIWVLAKTADPNIPPPMEWLDTFEEFPLSEIVPEITDMIYRSMGITVESKKK